MPSWSCSWSPREFAFPLINWASGGPLRRGETLPNSVRSSPVFMQAPRARNYGGIYSLEGHGTPFLRGGLTIVGFVVLGMVFRWAIVQDRDRWCKFDAAAGGLLLAGALGNQVDRLALGYVRDYVILAIRPTDIFNTADVFMVFGAVLLLGSLLINHRSRIARA